MRANGAEERGGRAGPVGGDRFLAKTKDLVSAFWTLLDCAKHNVMRKSDDDFHGSLAVRRVQQRRTAARDKVM